MKIERFSVPPCDTRNANMSQIQYDINRAAWIWHPDAPSAGGMVRFTLDFEVSEENFELLFQISADNRFELYTDVEYTCMGPDRSDINHWSFSSYKLSLSRGRHSFRADVYWYREGLPLAQMSHGAGFVFAVIDEKSRPFFNTGSAPWKCALIDGIDFAPGGWAIGNTGVFNVSKLHGKLEFTAPSTVRNALGTNEYGVLSDARKLYPSHLPEQIRKTYTGKITVRGVVNGEYPDGAPFDKESVNSPEIAKWQAFMCGETKSLMIESSRTVNVLLDFNDYLCAYPVLKAVGSDSSIGVYWAESLYSGAGASEKGNRSEVEGKIFRFEVQHDVFHDFMPESQKVSSLWWRAGRFVLIRIKTNSKPLLIEEQTFEESRYPLENESDIILNDEKLDSVKDMMLRALQACSHETFMDCPFYEQLMYVGDTRLEALSAYTLTRDKRLPERALELFSWSQSEWGDLISERYPCSAAQLSGTFSLIWPLLVRDFMMYRRFDSDSAFRTIRSRVRRMITAFSEYVNSDGLIENMPGWSFCDWVPAWAYGVPSGNTSPSCCSIYSLHYLLALQAASELEAYLPEGGGAFESYYASCSERTAKALLEKFYVREKSLFSDDLSHNHYSVHAQALALLCGILPMGDAENTVYAMLDSKDAAQPTVYYIFYLFEALKKYGFGDRIFNYTSIWTNMKALGAVTTWEMPEPTRSDCHAWGSHLYYHYFATIAGIRPDSPGFKTVRVTPSFGPLDHITGSLVHPDGAIEFDLKKDSSGLAHGFIILPETCKGRFACGGRGKLLSGGRNEI